MQMFGCGSHQWIGIVGILVIIGQIGCSGPSTQPNNVNAALAHETSIEDKEIKRVMDADENAKRAGRPGDMDKLEVIMAIDGEFEKARGLAIYTLVSWEHKGYVKADEVDDLIFESLKKTQGTDSVGSVTAYAMNGRSLKVLDDEKRMRIFKPIHDDNVSIGLLESQRKEIFELIKGGTFENEVLIGCIAASKKKIVPNDTELLLMAFPTIKSGDSYRDRFRRLMVKVIKAKSDVN